VEEIVRIRPASVAQPGAEEALAGGSITAAREVPQLTAGAGDTGSPQELVRRKDAVLRK